MLKKIYSIFLFLFLFTGCSDEVDFKTSAVVFTRPECDHCQDALEYIETILKPNNQALTFEIKDLSQGESRKLLKKYAHMYNIEKSHLQTPIIFTPKGYMSGWKIENSQIQLKMLLNIR